MIRFIAELNKTEEFPITINPYGYDEILELDGGSAINNVLLSTEDNLDIPEYPNIYEIKYTSENKHKIIEFYSKYLKSVSMVNIYTTIEALSYNDSYVYIHTMDDYLKSRKTLKYTEPYSFITSPINSIKAEPRLELPNFNIKLSDNINGIVLNQDFNLNIINNDGIFDNEDKWNLYNSPLHLYKSIIDNPKYEDFVLIRDGFINSINTKFESINISISDKIRSMDNSINNGIKQKNFTINIISESIDKNIPIVYGKNRVSLIPLDDQSYYISDYIKTLHGVYNNEGLPITYTYNANTRIIKTIEKPEYAIITGYTNNRIGEIIKDLMKFTDYEYNNTNFDIEEFELYLNESDRVNIVFSTGTVKSAIQEVLKSDMAYFIQKLDGRFTVRKYRDIYRTHIIPGWSITKNPEKDFNSAINNYFSSCNIIYNKQIPNFNIYLNDTRENELIKLYNKELRRTFNTNLENIDNARYLSNLLYDRYGKLKQTIKLNVGIDTTGMELLDFVCLDLKINDRNFNNYMYYIIKEINPAQDSIVLEEIDYLDLTGEYPETNYLYYEEIYDNMYAYTKDNEFEYIIEGGWL